MAKIIKAVIKLHIPAGQATPAPPVGPALAQHGINIGEFTQKFNEATKDKQGFKIPVDISIYEDRSFDFKLHQPPAAELIKKAIGLEKGSGEPNRTKVATMTRAQVRQIAEQKLEDLNTDNIEQAEKIIEGTAKSMGVSIE
ncbi:50S ribosomal protein L11 [Patescibacteria group bacterium]|nr:50S ribosomal protein L11 [Patescibacteria group bacterium]